MSTISYAAHVTRAQQQQVKPLSVHEFVKLVAKIYRMERNEKV